MLSFSQQEDISQLRKGGQAQAKVKIVETKQIKADTRVPTSLRLSMQ